MQVVDDAVKSAVHGAVQGAVQQVLVSHSKFDVRANTLTLIAITGVIIFWRGIWTMWCAPSFHLLAQMACANCQGACSACQHAARSTLC